MRRYLALVLLAGCGSFEDPTIVIDTRVLAVTAEPPEQVFDLDPQNPPMDISELNLVDATVCALVADPGEDRALDWTMTVCAPTNDGRCEGHGDRPRFELGSGRIEDPETAGTAQPACGTLPADAGLLLVLEDAIMRDELGGFSGIDVQVTTKITPAGGDDEDAIFAEKDVRYAIRLPAERTANTNPDVDHFDILVEDADPIVLPLGRCADQIVPINIVAGEVLPLIPVEPDGVREDYLVPTFDGGSRAFTENLTYQWLASAGAWNRAFSGGPHDISGAEAKLDATWEAPFPEDVPEPLDVSLWIIQRDERLGARWFESCVRVIPAE